MHYINILHNSFEYIYILYINTKTININNKDSLYNMRSQMEIINIPTKADKHSSEMKYNNKCEGEKADKII